MSKSILQGSRECWACRNLYNVFNPWRLEEHHIFPGTPRRALSERYGLKVYLCREHHNVPPCGVHFDPTLMLRLQQEGQRAFEKTNSREEFVRLFGKNYLE